MLKATAGGGGKGMRLCWNDEELNDGWSSARKKQLPHLEMMVCIWKNLLRNLDI